jgi:hypothetical protein
MSKLSKLTSVTVEVGSVISTGINGVEIVAWGKGIDGVGSIDTVNWPFVTVKFPGFWQLTNNRPDTSRINIVRED